jgi:hypothetical protein
MEEKVIWKRMIYHGEDLGDFYLVSNIGDIKGVKTGKIRSKNINHEGYYFVSVSLGSRDIKPCIKVHRAVAETFLDNPNNYPMINHKDGNKLNNHVENLEFCTNQENIMHALYNDLLTQSEKLICLNTMEVFPSVSAACRWCGLSEWSNSIYEYIKKTKPRKSAGKHPVTGEPLQWMYYEDYLKLHNDK